MDGDDLVEGTDFWEHRYYVSPHAVIEGAVTFGGGCVVLAGARIIARAGPLQFGAFCLVEEYAEVVFDRAAVDPEREGRHEEVRKKGGGEEEEDAPSGLASCGWRSQECESNPAMIIGPYNHLKAYAVLWNVPYVGSGNCFESFSRVERANVEPCPHRGKGVEWGLGDLCVVAPYVVVNVGEFDKINGHGVVESAPAGDAARRDARFLEGSVGPSRVTFLPCPAWVDEMQESPSRPPAGMQHHTKGFSVVPRHGTRSSAELAFIAQTLMPPRGVEGVCGGETRDSFVAQPSNPKLITETPTPNDRLDPQDGVPLIKAVLDGYTAVWEQDEIESLRKLCKYYLITYGWTASNKKR
ncbi:unnamed protein product [Phytomonas sp. EM1]|nr:unnamed protein product [Phytomonas sp. EM1]|eukprot:CCW64171.1 unnamed protein product [Phytomonas sp. isolate EM1]